MPSSHRPYICIMYVEAPRAKTRRMHPSHSPSHTNRRDLRPFLTCQPTSKKQRRKTIIIHIKSVCSPDLKCLFMLFYCLIVMEANLSACLQMAELRIILIHSHTRAYLFIFSPLMHFQLLLYQHASAHQPPYARAHGRMRLLRSDAESAPLHCVAGAECTRTPRQEPTSVMDWFVFQIRAN